MLKRSRLLTIVALGLTVLALWTAFSGPNKEQLNSLKSSLYSPASTSESQSDSQPALSLGGTSTEKEKSGMGDLNQLVKGKPIMAKMANETIRAEVGNAGWKMFHTILAQYPEEPTQEQRDTLHNYLLLFSRVYPCRECAEHFQQLITEYPPQLSSRKVAVMWGCDAHNKVNKRLGKEIFDCAYIDDKYDCGCAGDEDGEATPSGKEATVSLVRGG